MRRLHDPTSSETEWQAWGYLHFVLFLIVIHLKLACVKIQITEKSSGKFSQLSWENRTMLKQKYHCHLTTRGKKPRRLQGKGQRISHFGKSTIPQMSSCASQCYFLFAYFCLTWVFSYLRTDIWYTFSLYRIFK